MDRLELQQLRLQADNARSHATALKVQARMARVRAEAVGRMVKARHNRLQQPKPVSPRPWWEIRVPAPRREVDAPVRRRPA